jgi:hypothetical protein
MLAGGKIHSLYEQSKVRHVVGSVKAMNLS